MKSYDHLPITSLAELHAEMRMVKLRIREQEEDLKERWAELPGEAVKAVVIAVLPGFIGKELVSGVWALIKKGIGMVNGKGPEEGAGVGWKRKLINAAKQLGLYAALKLLFRLWKGR